MIDDLVRVVGERWVLSAAEQVATYGRDALAGHEVRPRAVVLPASTAETAAVVAACAHHGVPFVARGAGTGLSGGALPVEEGIVVALTRMRAVLALEPASGCVRVETGIRNATVSVAARPAGLEFAPDPSSQLVSTIGGNIAENSGGAHCLKHGFTTDHVLGATFVTAAGEIARIGASVADAPGLDLLAAIVGSEGTLGIVTEATLRLVPRAEAVETLLLAFDSAAAAGACVTAIVAAGIIPAATEFLDRATTAAVRSHLGIDYPDAAAVLLVEVDGPLAECDLQAPAIVSIATDCGALEVRRARSDAERADLWRGRKSAFAALATGHRSFYTQDAVVPRTRLAEVLAAIDRLAAETGATIGNVFHAGDGNIHPLILFDDRDPAERARAATVASAILDICVGFGGSITGEHGVGHDKACSLPKMFTGTDLTVMDRLRAAFDPRRLANPGKALPTPRLCGEIPGYHRVHPLEAAGVAERF